METKNCSTQSAYITLDSSIHFSGLERTWQSSDRQAHTRAITAPLQRRGNTTTKRVIFQFVSVTRHIQQQ